MIIRDHAYGSQVYPALTMKEIKVFRREGDAVILTCPFFQRVLQLRKLIKSSSGYLVAKGNGTGAVAPQDEARVQQLPGQLWLLPAHTSDSGVYTCIYRNTTFCVAGNITLEVFEPKSANIEKLKYAPNISAKEGEDVSLTCPHLEGFDMTEGLQWFKDSSPTALSLGSGSYHRQSVDILTIRGADRSHHGVYTCQLRFHINQTQYHVHRVMQLDVDAPAVQGPNIVSPVNGTTFETTHGSGLELFCKVNTDCQSADSTVVTWLVDGHSVESSFSGRALQGGRRVSSVGGGCQVEVRLLVLALSEEDTRAQLTCATHNQRGQQEVIALLKLEDMRTVWLIMAVAASACVLAVISVFLYYLLKPRRKMDYFLARQNSLF
ncbi:interleukin-1 receptor type 1-like [Aplochiton taeniatus]